MLDKLLKNLQQTGNVLKEQAGNIGSSAKEKSRALIDDWIQVIPRMEEKGLEMTSFSLGLAISPSLEIEMIGSHEDFSQERLKEILEECKGQAILTSVFSTIRTTYNLYERTEKPLIDKLILKIRVRLSPEIKVLIGEPRFG